MKTNEEIAKDIIGNWGYEEEAWWRPIFEALEAKDKAKYEGVSAWMNYGKKHKFWDYFEDEIDKKWEQNIKDKIGALIRIHNQLSKEIIGSDDFHTGSIQTLQNLERDLINFLPK